MPRCRLLPHGAYPLFPAVLASVAWVLSLAQDGCDYSRLTGPIVEDVTGSDAIPYLEVGFSAYREPEYNPDKKEWQTSYTGDCLAYPDEVDQDVFWSVSEIMAFLALVLGGGGALFLWFSSCFVFSLGTWRWSGYEVFLAFVFQCLSFLWFRTEICHSDDANDCALFFGSKANIGASVLFLVSAVLVICRYPVPKQDMEELQLETSDPEITIASTVDSPSSMLELPVEGDANVVLPTGESPIERHEEIMMEKRESESELI